jgi:hypothetical protein
MSVINILKQEEGFWSAFILIFLVTLALMGMSASVLLRSEAENTSNQIYIHQADYAANGAAYYGIQLIRDNNFSETSSLAIGNATVSLDTSIDAVSSNIILTVMANVNGIERGIEIELSPSKKLEDMAIYTEGDVFNVSSKDSLGNIDSDLTETNADSVPSIDEDSLAVLSTLQGHDQFAADFTPPDEYPDSSFYAPDGVTPNVTHVFGNLVVTGGTTIWGIFIVEGNAVIHGSARINGVIYLPNVTSTLITGGGDPSESSITGGIVSHGDIFGKGNHITVQHGPEYMREFCKFQISPDDMSVPVIKWEYI